MAVGLAQHDEFDENRADFRRCKGIYETWQRRKSAYFVGGEIQRATKTWLLDQLQKTDNVLELGCGAGQF
jgi:hypothetical protein